MRTVKISQPLFSDPKKVYLPRPSPSSPVLLLSFPKEVLDNVCVHLSKSSLVNLARVCRGFAHLSSHHELWASLNLCLPASFDARPPSVPEDLQGEELREWEERRDKLVELRGRAALKKLLETILGKADHLRWANVREIDLDPQPGTLLHAVRILVNSSPSLRFLTIRARSVCSTLAEYHTIEPHILSARFHFPSLTHVHIGASSGCSALILPHLCNAAPNLRHVNMVLCRSSPREEGKLPEYPAFPAETAVHCARLEITGCDGRRNDELTQTVIDFLAVSPHLRQLSLPHDGIHRADIAKIVLGLTKHEGIEDLHWPIDLRDYLTGTRLNMMLTLRRLVLACEDWIPLFNGLLTCTPNLEELYIDSSILDVYPDGPHTKRTPEGAMVPDFAGYLRDDASRLRIIHTLSKNIDEGDLDLFERIDAIERSGVEMGRVSSMTYNGAEVLHARLRMHVIEASDNPRRSDAAPASAYLDYENRRGSPRRKLFSRRPYAIWRDFTCYDGLAVPLDVIEEMERAAGKRGQDRRRRAVKVKKSVWDILTGWHRRKLISMGEVKRRKSEIGTCLNEDCCEIGCDDGEICGWDEDQQDHGWD